MFLALSTISETLALFLSPPPAGRRAVEKGTSPSGRDAVSTTTTLMFRPTVGVKKAQGKDDVVMSPVLEGGEEVLKALRLPAGVEVEIRADACRKAEIGVGWGGWDVGGTQEVGGMLVYKSVFLYFVIISLRNVSIELYARVCVYWALDFVGPDVFCKSTTYLWPRV